MQYVFFEKINAVYNGASGEFSRIFVLKVTLQSVCRLLLTASCRKIGAAGCTSCSPIILLGYVPMPMIKMDPVPLGNKQ